MIRSVHCDTIAAMQINKMQTYHNYNNILIYINSYMLWASLARHQGENVPAGCCGSQMPVENVTSTFRNDCSSYESVLMWGNLL